MQIVGETDARSEEKATSTECAIGALGKIALLHYDNAIVNQAIVHQYLTMLPLKAESEEAQNVHKLFFKHILGKNPALFAVPENKDKIVRALAAIKETATNEPELEIVATSDMELLDQCIKLF